MRLSEMKNLGPVNEEKLNEVGIKSAEELSVLGTEAAFIKVRHMVDEDACLHFLFALEGAIQDVQKMDLSSERKEELKRFYKKMK